MNKNRNGFQVMLGLIGMIKPLLGVMCIAIIMGCIGNLMAIFGSVLCTHDFTDCNCGNHVACDGCIYRTVPCGTGGIGGGVLSACRAGRSGGEQ